MRPRSPATSVLTGFLWLCSVILSTTSAYGQNALPTPNQLDQLLAPIALYPDALVAQICAASTDPQQIIDVDNWLHQNLTLTGQARTDAAQARGFDPAFIALINFPQVLDMMAQNIDSYATIGQAFATNQGMVMDSIQRLRQQAYAAGTLQTNDYQKVELQGQGGSQVVVIQPANPQVIYVPQYNPQVVYVQPDPNAVVAASLLTFGAGIMLGAWISNNSYPWGWGGWGWNWGRQTVIVNNNYWVVNNRYRPPYPSYHYRPPVYGPPIYARPPGNWYNRPGYRPPPPGYRPPPTTLPETRPPGQRPEYRPPGQQPGQRPPYNESRPPSGARPATPQYRPSPDAGYSRGPARASSDSGARHSAFAGGSNASTERAASNRGRASVASQQSRPSGGRRK